MPTSDKPNIVVLGSPRSGTTLLRRLLDAHPHICCPGETFLFKGAAKFLDHDIISGGFDYGVLGAMEGLGVEREDMLERLRAFVTGFYDDLAVKAEKPRWAAKTAIDIFYLPEIEQLLSGHCKFICVQRHGLDVACSMEEFTKNLGTYITELHYYLTLYPAPYEAFAHAWCDVTDAMMDFAERHADNCHVLKYEELIAAPDEEMKKLTDFLDEPALEKSCNEILNAGKRVDGIGDWKSFQKTSIESSSLGRWKDLPVAVVEQLAPIVNPTLQRAGYEPVAEGSDEDAKRRAELAKMLMQGS